MKRPKSQGQTRFLKETPKLLNSGELWLIHYFSIEKTTLNPLKEILMYNTNQEFLSCFLFMINPFNRDLPHIVTMGRDEILQQTPLKTPLEWYQTRMENGLKPMNTGF
ncbi:cag pathogenicity island protein [Helicobacter pylori]|uniref:cag pathogenicity island protein n=1 Tax=Helicobacter pylori TaxID=210 RepID=UPI0012E8A8E2|nr:cag pathogenicity island protein [Helicobacter pylori]